MRLLVMEMVNYGWEPVRWVYVLTDVGIIKLAGDTLSLAHENIFDIYRDDKNRMWIGTFGGGLNLAVSRKDRYVFRKFLTGSGRLQEVRMITQDNKKRVMGRN